MRAIKIFKLNPVQPEYHEKIPTFVDEAYESPESIVLRYEEGYEGGLLGRSGSPAEVLPMSAYGKPPPSHLLGFDTSRSYSESSFGYTTASHHASQPSNNPPTFQNATQMTQMSYGSHARASYDDTSPSYLNVGSTPTPTLISCDPTSGPPGTKIHVQISFLYDLATSTMPTFSLMFGNRRCPAELSKHDELGGVWQYIVSTTVPRMGHTEWNTAEVPLFLLMESGDGELMAKVEVGEWTYVEDGTRALLSRQNAMKKEMFDRPPEDDKQSGKIMSSLNQRGKDDYAYNSYLGADTSQFSPYLQTGPSYAGMASHYNPRSESLYQNSALSRAVYQYPNTSSPENVKLQSPQGPWPYSSSSSQFSQASNVSGLTSTSRSQLSSLPSPLPATPQLVRTSTMLAARQQAPGISGPSSQAYQPYSMYTAKAQLKIQGDLDSMCENWANDEWNAKRRILLFKRSQTENVITAMFKPISADERPPQGICVNCIYWEEKRQFFVTSVDTIALLESLVTARFTVEEKNRIRRNLEHFRPLTVKKSDPETESFFKVIMGFPAPKPRNIEKDVKVFAWKSLSDALKKILGKYSASPSSTLPPVSMSASLPPPSLPTPASSTGYATESSTATYPRSNDRNDVFSPSSVARSITGTPANHSNSVLNTSSNTYGISRIHSPPTRQDNRQRTHHHQGATPTHTSAHQSVPPDLRTPMSAYSDQTHQWPPAHHMPISQFPALAGTQAARGSWDLAAYLDPSSGTSSNAGPGTGAGSSLQTGSGHLTGTSSYARSSGLQDPSGGGMDRQGQGQSSKGLDSSHQLPPS